MKQPSCLNFSLTRFFTIGLICLFSYLHHDAQKRNVFAFMVGISNYEDDGIDKLRFAHWDAECFSTFLRSDAGENMPHNRKTL